MNLTTSDPFSLCYYLSEELDGSILCIQAIAELLLLCSVRGLKKDCDVLAQATALQALYL